MNVQGAATMISAVSWEWEDEAADRVMAGGVNTRSEQGGTP